MLVVVIGIVALVYQTIRSNSFISPLQKQLYFSVYVTTLWFNIARYSNYILELVGYELENPFFIFCMGLIPIAIALILQKRSYNLEESFRSLKSYGSNDPHQFIDNLESLVQMYTRSEEDVHQRTILLGYVAQYQRIHDKYQDN